MLVAVAVGCAPGQPSLPAPVGPVSAVDLDVLAAALAYPSGARVDSRLPDTVWVASVTLSPALEYPHYTEASLMAQLRRVLPVGPAADLARAAVTTYATRRTLPHAPSLPAERGVARLAPAAHRAPVVVSVPAYTAGGDTALVDLQALGSCGDGRVCGWSEQLLVARLDGRWRVARVLSAVLY